MAWRFDAATDKILVASGWTGSVATVLMWVRRVVDRNTGSNPWRAWSNAAGGGSTVAGIGSDGGGDTIVSFDSAFSNLTGPSLVGNTWHCIGLVMNGTAWSLYHGSDPANLTVATGTKANATSPGSWTLVDNPDFLSGDIHGVKLFTRALSAVEVAAELADPGQVSATNLTWRGTLSTSSTTPETGTAMTAGGTGITVVEGPALPATSTTTISATAAARLAGSATSTTTTSATATAQALGTATSTTTIAATAAARLAGAGTSTTTIGATASARPAGSGTSTTTISATATARRDVVATGLTTIAATAAARLAGSARSEIEISAAATGRDLTPPLIEGVPRAGTLTMTGVRRGSALALSSGLRASTSVSTTAPTGYGLSRYGTSPYGA